MTGDAQLSGLDHPSDLSPGPVPVFVLGLQRSGTTWIANILGAHPSVACVEAEDHRGIHESIFFSHFASAYGDLSDDRNFSRFVTDFAASDYYVLTGIDEEWLRRLSARDYAVIFREVMDELARRRGASFWIEKSPHHTLLCGRLAHDFPDARFVCVLRKTVDLVRSRIWAFGRTPPRYPRRFFTLLRACAGSALYQRTLQRFASECDRVMLIHYEDLRTDTEATVRRVTTFIGVLFDSAMLQPRYAPNSSFRSPDDRSRALGPADRLIVAIAATFLHFVPLSFLLRLEAWKHSYNAPVWPDWVWRRKSRPASAEASLGLGEGTRRRET
jgi:hypothetical protein